MATDENLPAGDETHDFTPCEHSHCEYCETCDDCGRYPYTRTTHQEK